MIRVVVSDTNILINLCYSDDPFLLGRIPQVQFVISVEVETEMRRGRGRRFADVFSRLLNEGHLSVEEAAGLRAIEVYVRCRDEHRLDEGESAAMALAASKSCYFATTDFRAFAAAKSELGGNWVVHLEDILDFAIDSGVLSGEAAEKMRQLMATRNGYRGWGRE